MGTPDASRIRVRSARPTKRRLHGKVVSNQCEDTPAVVVKSWRLKAIDNGFERYTAVLIATYASSNRCIASAHRSLDSSQLANRVVAATEVETEGSLPLANQRRGIGFEVRVDLFTRAGAERNPHQIFDIVAHERDRGVPHCSIHSTGVRTAS